MGTNEKKFQKLTPIHDADIGIYEEALDFVFENDDVRNVAISGAYSAGKSSIIETYKKLHEDKKIINISLAFFRDAEDRVYNDDELNLDKDDMKEQSVLEGKILNQLIHQVDVKDIPQTNFRIKRTISNGFIFVQTFILLLLGVLIIYTLNFDAWRGYIESLNAGKDILTWTTKPICRLVSSLISTGLIGCIVFWLMKMQKDRSILKKLNINGSEIEIFEQSDESYFDKYLNEILYLFENSGADVVVFEDLDRFNNNQIFQRLREVNVLVNNRKNKCKKEPMRFFYLIRDDIFVSKDRTKFFDFIIPVVPILDGSNSYDQFIAHFRTGGIFDLFDENFLQGISLYVDDMRILKNIYNEFVVYNARVGTTEQNPNKLLAMIVYKNLFPRDFSDLQLNKGFVYAVFKSKEQLINEKKRNLQIRIDELSDESKRLENEILKTTKELDTLYSTSNYMDYYRKLLPEYVKEKAERKSIIELRNNGRIEEIKSEIDTIEEQIWELNSNIKLCEVINRENIDSLFKTNYTNEIGKVDEFLEIKGTDYFDLLKYLIRNGFVDETYTDYMSYFYENSLSRVDKMFLRSVTDQKAKEYTYALKNPQLVLKRLNIHSFENQEVLNFDLLEYMLKEMSLYSQYLEVFIFQLKSSKRYDFVIKFIETREKASEFIQVINKHWCEFFLGALNESEYTERQMKTVALLSVLQCSTESLSAINKDNSLTEYISNCPDFLQIENPQVDLIIDKLIHLDVKFINLDYSISNVALWKQMYSNNLYELNEYMIESILINQYEIQKDNEYNHKNFSLIISKPQEPLAVYVEENIDAYFHVMWMQCEGKIIDSEIAIISLLNNEELDVINKETYIRVLSSKLTSLACINEKYLWSQLLKNDVIVFSEDNIFQYFFTNECKYDDELIEFINQNADSFSVVNYKI